MSEKQEWSVPALDQAEVDEVLAAFADNWLTMGPRVRKFEQQMAEYVGAPHAIAVSNGSVAIEIALQILGLGVGDEIIVPSLTYFATAAAVSRLGGVPVFVDIDKDTFGLDANAVDAAITSKTKGLIFIDYGGCPARIDQILQVADKHGLYVIQDAAQSLGATFHGRPLGAQAPISTMSFHMAKVMTTVEGGMIFTHQEDIAKEARIYRNQGESGKYLHSRLGTNARMTDMAAAVGLQQFKKLPQLLAGRARVAARYRSQLASSNQIHCAPNPDPGTELSNFFFPVLVENRDEVAKRLLSSGVDTRVAYPMPVYEQEVYASGRARSRTLPSPVAEWVTARILNLPIYADMRDEQADRVAATLQDVVATLSN
jgi:perosamine synthetase